MGGAVTQLQGLDEELDVDEPAASELHVTPSRGLLAKLELHASAHLSNLLGLAGRQRRAVDETLEQAPQPPAEGGIAEHQARPRQRLPLPQIAVLGVVTLGRGQARGEPAALAAGAEPKIDGK